MKRDYKNGVANSVTLFVGREVEHTPAFGMLTLFVTGLQTVKAIEGVLSDHDIKHIFFGANHSFNPKTPDDWRDWEMLIMHFLKKDYLCSLDIPISVVEEFNEGGLCEFNNFIPQIRVAIPYVKLWNYNTMVKIDDKDFRATNPGVWSHSLHDLMSRDRFTSWDQYKDDQIIL